MQNITLNSLQSLKQSGEKIAMLTCYDATFAQAASTAGVEMLLVGDTLGMVLQGNDSTLPVTVNDVAYHVASVKRGNRGSFIVADLPFMSYATIKQTLHNSACLMMAGANMVKLEGDAWLAESVHRLTENGVPVCAHLGLTPQSVNVLGGFKVQGRDPIHARQLVESAYHLEQAGAAMLVVECIPTHLAEQISETVRIPVIGIGAGSGTDGQVLVLHDMLGMSLTSRTPKFVRNFLLGENSIQSALEAYVAAVKNGVFPAQEHSYSAQSNA